MGTLDPAMLQSQDELLVAAQIFDGLVEVGSEGEILPAAARTWEVTDRGTRFVFHLGESSFHDGSPVRAQDFLFAWERLLDPVDPRPFAFLLEEVEGFRRHRLTFGARPITGLEAPDDATLEVTLREPNLGFPAVLAHPALSPVPEGSTAADLAVRPIGNGPYALTEDLGLGTPIVLQAAEGVDARVATVELRPSAAPEESWPEFLARELEVARIPPTLVGEPDELGVHPIGRLLYCGFNLETDRFPQPLRAAVSMGIDREALVRSVYGGLAVPADGIVPPSFPGYRPGACGGRCELARDRAEDLVGELPRRERIFRLDFPRTSVGAGVAERVRDQLAEIGLTAQLRGHDEADYAELLREGEHAAFCLVWVADAPTPQAMLDPLLAPSSPDNRTGIDNEELTSLLTEARTTREPDDREELYVAAERRALEAMPLVPLAWFRSSVVAQPYVTGLEVDPLGRFDVAALAFEG